VSNGADTSMRDPSADRFVPRRVDPRRALRSAGQHTTMLIVSAICLAPFYYLLVTSLKTAAEFRNSSVALPSHPTLANYSTAWTELGFRHMFVNSAILSVSSAVLSTVVAAAAAYAFSRFHFAGRRVLLAITIAAMAIPAVVIIIPVYLWMSQLGWTNTYKSAILAEAGLLLPFSVFLLYSYMRDLPDELFDAATVDGAKSIRIFWSIVLPLSRPAIVTTSIIAAIFAWNDLLIPLILWGSDQLQTLMVGLALLGPSHQGVADVPLLMTGVTLSILPLIVLYVVSRRAIVRGLLEGAGK
jgi:sn-glycerol 3-phosphate transport system permease protein